MIQSSLYNTYFRLFIMQIQPELRNGANSCTVQLETSSVGHWQYEFGIVNAFPAILPRIIRSLQIERDQKSVRLSSNCKAILTKLKLVCVNYFSQFEGAL